MWWWLASLITAILFFFMSVLRTHMFNTWALRLTVRGRMVMNSLSFITFFLLAAVLVDIITGIYKLLAVTELVHEIPHIKEASGFAFLGLPDMTMWE